MQKLLDLIRRSVSKAASEKKALPLLHPLGRANDQVIDAALRESELSRADLFRPETSIAPHRHRIARMIPMQGLDPETLTRDFWATLKEMDHRCAHCENTRRCERWLRWGRVNDAPRMFCPNATTFEAIRHKTKRQSNT